jgi:hypothetical protein
MLESRNGFCFSLFSFLSCEVSCEAVAAQKPKDRVSSKKCIQLIAVKNSCISCTLREDVLLKVREQARSQAGSGIFGSGRIRLSEFGIHGAASSPSRAVR